MEKTCVILVVTHKDYWMPKDSLYRPLQVGSGESFHASWLRDNTGDHISEKNPHFCELTGLYWAWKNMGADIIGLCHYRRYPGSPSAGGPKTERLLTRKEIDHLLKTSTDAQGVDILLPRKRHYWIETNYSQYAHAHHAIDLDITRQIVSEKYPAYLPVFEASMRRRKGHRFNMFIMKQDQLDAYCAWLFDILFELEKRLDITGYSKNDQRVFGFVGERLLDVWPDTNAVAYQDVPYVFMERQNWIMKGWKFLKKKLGWK